MTFEFKYLYIIDLSLGLLVFIFAKVTSYELHFRQCHWIC